MRIRMVAVVNDVFIPFDKIHDVYNSLESVNSFNNALSHSLSFSKNCVVHVSIGVNSN